MSGAKFAWSSFRGHVLRPTLVVAFPEKDVKIHIHVMLAPNVFKLTRFAPGRNMVRKGAVISSLGLDFDATSIQDEPTPIYNTLILIDMMLVAHLKLIHTECKRIAALKEAIKLGKAWIHQRGYSRYSFCLSGFQFSIICAYLARIGSIEPHMTDLQIFKMAVAFLVDLSSGSKCFMFPEMPSFTRQKEFQSFFTSDSYQAQFAVSLVEPVTAANIFFDWTAETALEVAREAKRALQLLAIDNLDALFIQRQGPLSTFDAYFTVDPFDYTLDQRANFKHYANEFSPAIAKLKMVAKKLKYGLNTRLSGLSIFAIHSPGTKLVESPRPFSKLQVGLTFNRDECQRIVELGPLATNEAECHTFRAFWREKSELRRFHDGSIREAVAFDKFKDRRHLVVAHIVDFIFLTHLGGNETKGHDDALDHHLIHNSSFSTMTEALNRLTKHLKDIHDLPLGLNRCEAISPSSRMTSVSAPKKLADSDVSLRESLPLNTQVTKVVLYLEESSRWPTDYYGMLYAKQAFAVKLCRILSDRYGLSVSMTDHYFDVLCEGFIFRCSLYYANEAKLMTIQGLDSQGLLLDHEERPKHSRALSALSTGDSQYAPTCRLVKTWLDSLLLTLQIPEELIELIVAHPFLDPSFRPNTAVAGFVRTLMLFKDFGWEKGPLLVDFEKGENKSCLAQTALTNYQTSHNQCLLYVAPSYETNGGCSVWSRLCSLDADDLARIRCSAQEIIGRIEAGERIKLEPRLIPGTIAFRLGEIVFTETLQRSILKHSHRDRFLRSLPAFPLKNFIITDIRDLRPEARIYSNLDPKGLIMIRTAEGEGLEESISTIEAHFGNLVTSVRTL